MYTSTYLNDFAELVKCIFTVRAVLMSELLYRFIDRASSTSTPRASSFILYKTQTYSQLNNKSDRSTSYVTPLTAGSDYIQFFIFLLAQKVPPVRQV